MTLTPTNPPDLDPADTDEVSRRNRSLIEIILGSAIVIAILWGIGGWAVPFVIIAIVLMVVVHELGHFVTAKLTGMKATEFFVGFGPRVWSRQVGETEVGLKAIVVGGYVRILGMTTVEELKAEDEPRSFRQATFPRRVLVASAGSIMHLVMALVLAWCSIFFIGRVTGHENQVESLTHWVGVSETAAQRAGIKPGDIIVSVDGHSVATFAAFESIVQKSINTSLAMTVNRNGTLLHLHVTPQNGRLIKVLNAQNQVVAESTKNLGFIGVGLSSYTVQSRVSFLNAFPDTFGYVGSVISAVGVGTYHVFSPAGISSIVHADSSSTYAQSATFTDTYRPTSIYGIVHLLIQISYKNPSDLLVLFMLVNLAIGLVNMLPMLPLDGGYVAIAIYERLRTRRGQPNYHADVNKLTPFVYAFLALLLVVALSSLYLDIVHPLTL